MKCIIKLWLMAKFCSATVPIFAQANLKSSPVSDQVIRVFLNARCSCSDLDTLQLRPNAKGGLYPNLYRSSFVNSIYTDADGTVPFQVYYAEKQGGQLYLVQKGWCRNISTSIPLPAPGWYFVRYFHEGKPALVEVDATTPILKVRSFGKCELHN